MKATQTGPALIFRGTTDQLEQAGDFLILLSYVRTMRIGRIIGPLVTVFLALAGFTQLRDGKMSMFFIYMLLTLYVGLTIMRKTSGGDPAQSVRLNRESRNKAAQAGRYNGELPFQIILDQGQCRIYFGENPQQPSQVFDCRKFRSAVECDEIVWVRGRRNLGIPLPKAQLSGADAGDLRRWLKHYVAVWSTYHIPEKLKKSIELDENKEK